MAEGPGSQAQAKPFLVRRAKATSLAVLVLVGVSAVGVGFLPGSGTAPPPDAFGYAIEDFTVTTIEGETVRLSTEIARGRVVLLDFMFVNCPACRVAMPHLVALRNEFSTDELTMISLDLVSTETEAMLAGFRDEFGADWHFALDTTGELKDKFNVNLFPSTMIVAPTGWVAFAAEGVIDSGLLISVVRSLVV
jgi:cytochrome oxidase Cu insertion factor (SCO1/SenC/PrrC family)